MKLIFKIYYKLKHTIFNFRMLWFYEAYLTLRYVDEYDTFPCFKFNNSGTLKIKKNKNSKLIIKKKLIFESWMSLNGKSSLLLNKNSTLIVENDFSIGDNIKIHLSDNSKLVLKGKKNESASGITASSIILVYKHIEIGYDCIIAWDTFITDCDWHTIENKKPYKETIIGNKVWIGVGAKILKGAIIGNNSIITSNSVVISGNYSDFCLLSGNPAEIKKTEIENWNRDLIIYE